VDDEPSVLSSLKRLLRSEQYQVVTAQSGKHGLELMANEPIDLVISDMRMPEMTGAEFLKSVAENYPETIRILLTGYSDMEATIQAINDGQINRYLHKPWNNDELLQAVQEGKDKLLLERENQHLLHVIEHKNSELTKLNSGLEEQVEHRTQQISSALKKLNLANKTIKGNLNSTIHSFYNLISLESDLGGEEALKISNLCHLIAKNIFDPEDKKSIKNAQLAGLLCQLGLVGLPKHILKSTILDLSGEDKLLYHSSAQRAFKALSPALSLKDVSLIIKHQFDGYSTAKAAEISKDYHFQSAEILAVARDYIYATSGRLQRTRLSAQGAIELMTSHSEHYNPALVGLLPKLVQQLELDTLASNERIVAACDLKKGMKLSRGVYTSNSILLLPEGHIFSTESIQRLTKFLAEDHSPAEIFVFS
jgi:response regulator RpfG family c-di-GMP phosphodiesterase